MTQFFETKNGKNIAYILEELVNELKELRTTISSLKTSS